MRLHGKTVSSLRFFCGFVHRFVLCCNIVIMGNTCRQTRVFPPRSPTKVGIRNIGSGSHPVPGSNHYKHLPMPGQHSQGPCTARTPTFMSLMTPFHPTHRRGEQGLNKLPDDIRNFGESTDRNLILFMYPPLSVLCRTFYPLCTHVRPFFSFDTLPRDMEVDFRMKNCPTEMGCISNKNPYSTRQR